MNILDTQELAESLLKNKKTEKTTIFKQNVVIAFGASWCKPCRNIDKKKLVSSLPNITWYYCDVDINNYSLGYFGFRSIPSYVLIENGVPNKNTLQGPPSTDTVIDWLKLLVVNSN